MIWFACRQCGKIHGRSDNSAGTLIFCECGQGNSVPWESTAAAPEPSVVLDAGPAAPPPPTPGRLPLVPTLVPVPVSEETGPPVPRRQAQSEERGSGGYCFNHPRTRSLAPCASCNEQFCGGCLVTLAGRQLCGPCKNRELRHVAEAPKLSGQCVGSIVIAGVGVPLLLLLVLASPTALMLTLAILALLPMAFAAILGWQALLRATEDPQQTGRSLALTGVVGGLVGCALVLVVLASYWLQWG